MGKFPIYLYSVKKLEKFPQISNAWKVSTAGLWLEYRAMGIIGIYVDYSSAVVVPTTCRYEQRALVDFSSVLVVHQQIAPATFEKNFNFEMKWILVLNSH